MQLASRIARSYHVPLVITCALGISVLMVVILMVVMHKPKQLLAVGAVPLKEKIELLKQMHTGEGWALNSPRFQLPSNQTTSLVFFYY